MASSGVDVRNPLPSDLMMADASPNTSILRHEQPNGVKSANEETSVQLHAGRQDMAARLHANEAKRIPTNMWWMQTLNLFPQQVYVEDEAAIRSGFQRTVCFVTVLVVLVISYFTVQLTSNIDGKVVLRQTGPNPTLSEYLHILNDPSTLGTPSCPCGAPDVSRLVQSTQVEVPAWGNLSLGVNGLATTLYRNAYVEQIVGDSSANVPLPAYAGGANISCRGMQPARMYGETRTQDTLDKLTPQQRCSGSMIGFMVDVLSQFAERQFTFKLRLLSQAFPSSLLSPTGFNSSVERIVQDGVLQQASEFYTAINALLSGTAWVNRLSPSSVRRFRNLWDDCAVPGTAVDIIDGTPNCTCDNASPTCSTEVYIDPHRMYPPGDPERPPWVNDKPWRIVCPSFDQMPATIIPHYFMRADRFYGKDYLDCTGGQVDTSFPAFTYADVERLLDKNNLTGGFQLVAPLPAFKSFLPQGEISLSMLMWAPISSLSTSIQLSNSTIRLNPGLLTSDYSKYFLSCQPSQCQYSYKEETQWLPLLIQALSLIGGLQIVLRTIVDASFDTVAAWCGKGVSATRNTLSSLVEREGRGGDTRHDSSWRKPQVRKKATLGTNSSS